MRKTITIKFSVADAHKLGLLICACGHLENNHYRWGTVGCAHCTCLMYRERPRLGKIVARTPMRYRRNDVFVDRDGSLWELFAANPKQMSYMLLGRDQNHGHSVMTFVPDEQFDANYTFVGRL